MIENPTAVAQATPPSGATRLALLATLVASFLTVYASGFIPLTAVALLIAMVVVAQLVGQPGVLGTSLARFPTTAIALGVVLVAVYVTMQVGLVAGGIIWCAALFVLCLDWNSLARLPLPLLLSVLLVTVSMTRGQLDQVVPALVVWTIALVTTLVLMERDATGSGRRLQGSGPPRPSRGRPVVEIVAVGLLLLLLVPLIGALLPNPPQGRPRGLGNTDDDSTQTTPYWGFDDRLDTSTRGQLSDEVVMRVQAEAPDFWRGTTFDEWDGRVWTKSRASTSGYPSYGTVNVRPSLGDALGGTTFKQVVTVEKPGSDLLFGAYRTTQLDAASPATVDRNDGTVRVRQPLSPGAVYTVVSQRKLVTAESLRGDDPLAEPIPRDIARRYLQLPDHVPERVVDLGQQITAGAPTTYDKVRAIETWMGDNTEYTLDIPPLPAGADAVEQHLFVDKKGFCEQIATSTTVLLRSLGIPARLATGYVAGDRSVLTGEYTVRAKDAHAWVEVWFPKTGWQAFDPTADVPLAGEYSTSWWPLVLAIGLVVVAVLLGLLLFAKLPRRGRKPTSWAGRATQRLLRDGDRRWAPRRPEETLIEYAERLARYELPDERIPQVGRLLSGALFSGRDPTPEQQAWADRVLDDVERAHPPKQIRRRRKQEAKAERRRARDEARAAATRASREPVSGGSSTGR